MRILFVAKHDSGDNDDEGAVGHALTALGHDVVKVHELRKHRKPGDEDRLRATDYDFCLFFKWGTVSEIREVRVPRAFWFFDMVRPVDGDPTLSARSAHRVQWMNEVIPLCVAGFCTDGDWIESCNRVLKSPLVHLMQGADERYVGFGTPIPGYDGAEILFTGMINHGQKRAAHVAHLKERYGDRFGVLGDGGPRHRKHGRALADLFASVKIVVAPDGPNTDLYWSNRVYLTTGLGGFLLHPYCKGLTEQYEEGEELLFYKDQDDLDRLIDEYCVMADGREWMRKTGFNATVHRNLYRHRCAVLIDVMKERLK